MPTCHIKLSQSQHKSAGICYTISDVFFLFFPPVPIVLSNRLADSHNRNNPADDQYNGHPKTDDPILHFMPPPFLPAHTVPCRILPAPDVPAPAPGSPWAHIRKEHSEFLLIFQLPGQECLRHFSGQCLILI